MISAKQTILLVLCFFASLSGAQDYHFDHMSVSEGLSQSAVTCILQDNDGYMWFGTASGGLNRFDGYNFKIFRKQSHVKNSIAGNRITCALLSMTGVLWIGTRSGLSRFDKKTQTFYNFNEFDSTGLNNSRIISILEDHQGTIWLGTVIGLNKYRAETNDFISFTPGFDLRISSLVEYDSDHLLICSQEDGLFLFNKQSHHFSPFLQAWWNNLGENQYLKTIYKDSQKNIWLGGHFLYLLKSGDSGTVTKMNLPYQDKIHTINEIKRGILWIGTEKGLFEYHWKTNKFTHYQHEPDNPYSLYNNPIIAVYKDRDQNLWIGTWGGGIGVVKKNRKPFYHYLYQKKHPHHLNNIVTSFEKDEHDIWIGTERDGLYYYDLEAGTFHSFKQDSKNTFSLQHNKICDVLKDNKGRVWVGMYYGGLDLFNKKSHTFHHILPECGVNALANAPENRIWLGTIGNGLILFDPESNHQKRFLSTRKSNRLINNRINCLYNDSNGRLWIGTADGVSCYIQNTDSFVNYPSLSGYLVHSFVQDRYENIWVGTNCGLHCINPITRNVKSHFTSDILNNMYITGLLYDNQNNLWISSHNGIYKYNPDSGLIINFDDRDGLQSDEFSRGACMKSPSGLLFFGGINGFNIFHPDSIKKNPVLPPINFTDLQFFDRSVPIGKESSPLRYHINNTKLLELSHKQAKAFTLHFVGIDYTAPHKIKYKYKLKGYHDGWIQNDTKRSATFTNLDAGEYEFQVAATNSDGLSTNNTIRSLFIKIRPPFWKSNWAFALYIFLFLLIIWLYHIYSSKMWRLKHELKVKQLEKEKVDELNSFKSKFFANITHDFRTPLTLILSPATELIKRSDHLSCTIRKQYYQIIKQNAERLLRFINQILEFNKNTEGKLRLELSYGNLVDFVQNIGLSFKPLAEEKEINLHINKANGKINTWFDAQKLEEVIFNLLSNAIKFCARKGQISISILQDNHKAKICIKDTGPGLKQNEIFKIFERFYQSSDRQCEQGLGIGLSLCKEFIQLHGGNIYACNHKDGGALFTIELPLNKLENQHELQVNQDNNENVLNDKTQTHLNILIVDDDSNLRKYLRLELQCRYLINEARNGEEGLELARIQLPDIIISDVMMPGIDGIEFCHRLKTDELTSHIPVILLTAKTSEYTRLQGLDTGADDYIVKPFNISTLKARIQNLLNTRRELCKRFRRELHIEPADITVNSTDESFITRAIKIIEEHMDDLHFNINEFSKIMKYSRSNFYNKIKSITGLTPSEFIQNIRLKRAARLMKTTDLSITQIVYEVGFNYPSYFSQQFKKQFGLSPKKYKQGLMSKKS